MARVPYLTATDLQPEDQELLARNLNLYRALVNSPKGARSFSRLGGFIRFQSKLDPRLREMAILQVGYLARAPYEYSHHIRLGREFGVHDDDIRAIARETAGQATNLDALSKTVLRAAREMTAGPAITDATWDELAAVLDNEALTDLVITISFYNGVVRLLASLQVDVEDDYLHYLEEFPLPKE